MPNANLQPKRDVHLHEATDRFIATGELSDFNQEFNYLVGGEKEGYDSPFTLDTSYPYQEGGFCRLSADYTSCSSCGMQRCSNEDPYFAGPLLNCTNIPGGQIYHLCDDSLEIEDGPFQFLSPEFHQCLDIVPVNAECANATTMTPGESILGSVLYAPTPSGRRDHSPCLTFSMSGLYYHLVGTG